MSEIIWDGAVAQAAAIRRGDVTATEILDEYLDRIERYDPQLRAYVAVDAERAAADARQADELVRAGVEELPPFLGVTISLKDVIDVEGVATTHSSKALVDNVPDADGPLAALPAARRLHPAGQDQRPRVLHEHDRPRTSTASAATRGTANARLPVRAGAPAPRSRPDCAPSRTAPTAPDRSAGRPRSAAWSAPSRRAASSRSVRRQATPTTAPASTGS